MNGYPKNFEPSKFLGVDGGGEVEDDDFSPWSSWYLGEDARFPKDFALSCWWHFCDALSTFVMWDDGLRYPEKYIGGGDLAKARFRNDLIPMFQTLHNAFSEPWKTDPYAIESTLLSLGDKVYDKKESVQTMCIYCIKCFDDGISGLMEGNPTKAAMAFTFAHQALDIAHEYRGFRGAKNALRNMSRSGGLAKSARDPRQKEKDFVFECWNDWQKRPDSYKGKADFARQMLDKCEKLISQKTIEDWCREWEKK